MVCFGCWFLSWHHSSLKLNGQKKLSSFNGLVVIPWYKRVDQWSFSMTQPFKHPKTGIYDYRKVVPEPFVGISGKREEKRSLKSKDPQIAKQRHIEVSLEIERHWAALSEPATNLSS
nr:DUF6538 domain-containing protein [uncultured Cohaesibacter sp.]